MKTHDSGLNLNFFSIDRMIRTTLKTPLEGRYMSVFQVLVIILSETKLCRYTRMNERIKKVKIKVMKNNFPGRFSEKIDFFIQFNEKFKAQYLNFKQPNQLKLGENVK